MPPKAPEILSALKLGSKVRIKNYSPIPGKIVELRGPLGPHGINIYRVLMPKQLGGSLIEVREDQLEATATLTRVHSHRKPKRRKSFRKPHKDNSI